MDQTELEGGCIHGHSLVSYAGRVEVFSSKIFFHWTFDPHVNPASLSVVMQQIRVDKNRNKYRCPSLDTRPPVVAWVEESLPMHSITNKKWTQAKTKFTLSPVHTCELCLMF